MIKKPSEIKNEVLKIKMLIAGFPGIGKTTLALSAPKPLHIDVDLGVTRVNARDRKDYIQPSSYEELLEDLRSDLSDYETLVFDTGGKLLDLMKPYVIRQNSQNGQKDGSLSLKGYGAVKREFQQLMDFAYYELKKHVIVLFHAKEEKDGEATKLRILVDGQTKDNVWQSMELGGFMEMVNGTRTIGFSNCERYFAKATHGINGVIQIPELDGKIPNDFITKLFAKVNDNIRKETEYFENVKSEYKKVMKTYVSKIEKMTEEDVNDIFEEIANASHVLTSEKELKHKFLEKVKTLDVIWNSEEKVYEKISDNTHTSE